MRFVKKEWRVIYGRVPEAVALVETLTSSSESDGFLGRFGGTYLVKDTGTYYQVICRNQNSHRELFVRQITS